MGERGDRGALQKYVLAHLDHQRALTQVQATQETMARERGAAMRYLQENGTTRIEILPEGSLMAKLRIYEEEPGIIVF